MKLNDLCYRNNQIKYNEIIDVNRIVKMSKKNQLVSYLSQILNISDFSHFCTPAFRSSELNSRLVHSLSIPVI